MTNPAKAKGSAFERAVAAYMRDHGLPYMDRRFGAGQQKDKGDLVGDPEFVYECKAHKAFAIAQWLKEAEAERGHANALYGVVVAKRPRAPIGQSVVMMTLETYMEMRKNANQRPA